MPLSPTERSRIRRLRQNEELDALRTEIDEYQSFTETVAHALRALRTEIKKLQALIESRHAAQSAAESFPPIPPLGFPLDSLPNPPLIPPSETRARRGSRLSDEWSLSPADHSFAEKLGLDIELTLDSFYDYWRSKPGQAGCKLDWSATWRNWCRKTPPPRKHSSNGHAGDVPAHNPMYGPPEDPAVLIARIQAKTNP